ncbi:nonstructural protein 3 [Chaphamaparvovirus galliform5]|nr:nonstructural protein 3 [Chaphamaparvovirus galliform5]
MAGFGSSSGFTLLVWLDTDSWRLQNVAEEQRLDKEKEMLEDICTLLCGRWGMEGSVMEDSGHIYAFFSCAKFVVSTATLLRAVGDLADSVKLHRGSFGDKPEFLIRYRKCLLKYHVAEKVSDAFSGEGYEGSNAGNNWSVNKRQRTK